MSYSITGSTGDWEVVVGLEVHAQVISNAKLFSGAATAFGVPRGLVIFHLITGEIEKAADWCERAIEQRDGFIAVSTAFPLYKPLRESPRWPKVAKMMNLPEGA